MFIIGDHEGHNALCGHFNSGNYGVQMPFRDCRCAYADLDKDTFGCKETSVLDWLDVKGDPQKMKKHSRHMLTFNTFENAPIADLIDLCLPLEVLHVFGNGISKYQIEVFNQIIGIDDSNKAGKDKFDGLHPAIAESVDRQSDRSMPRHSTRNGVLDKTKMTANERRGNLFLILVVLHTTEGSDLFKPCC